MSDNEESKKNTDKIIKKNIKWTHEHENILVDWADKALCYRWLHSKNYDRYNTLNIWFTIPVIIMSTLTGTANFAQDRVPIEIRSYFAMLVGGVNIVAGIITTIQNFLKISQLNESHRVASIAWDKFYRKLKVELSKSPIERQNVELYVKHSTEEYDRLMETSPRIEEQIIKKFNNTFGINELSNTKILTEQQKLFKELKKPEICDILESVKNSVYKEPIRNKLVSADYSNNVSNIVKQKINLDSKEKKILEFSKNFNLQFNRDPTEEEIIENMENEQEKINSNIILNWRNKYKENKIKTNLSKENIKTQNNISKNEIIENEIKIDKNAENNKNNENNENSENSENKNNEIKGDENV